MNLDIIILDFIQANMRNGFMDYIMPPITKLANLGIIWIILSICLLLSKKTRKIGFAMIISLAMNVIVCNILLKPMVGRIRPCHINTSIELLINGPIDFSFPSGHTSISFTAVGVLFFRKNKLFLPALILAILIGFSRLYLYVHYPSDVLAGAILGILFGYIGHKIILSKDHKKAGSSR